MDSDGEDLISFQDETVGGSEKNETVNPWRILIVDDNNEIHTATRFALSAHMCEGRKLEFESVFSGKEALETIASSRNELPDLVLMDVVMDTASDGIDTTHEIRKLLAQHDIPFIIIRTGQAGYIDIEAIGKDNTIDMLLLKSEMTAERLRTAVFEGLQESRKRGMKKKVEDTSVWMRHK